MSKPVSKVILEATSSQLDALARQAELVACKTNLYHHLENHFQILDKAGKVRLMKPLKQAQKKLISLYLMCKKQRMPCRIIVLKARKEGLSTAVQALIFLSAMEEGKTGLVIAHDAKTSDEIFAISDRFYKHYDLPKPSIPVPNRREMRFEKKEGKIMVETANNVQAGTGLTPHFLHCSEVAKWAKGSKTAVALFQSVGHNPDTTIIMESTAQGFDSLFHPSWENSDRHCKVEWNEDEFGNFHPELKIIDKINWNGYIPLFVSWFEDPDYKRKFENQDEELRFAGILEDYEKMLIDRYNVNLQQLYWRRTTGINGNCRGDIRIFKQEYPSFPEEAFIVSGRTKFNLEKLDVMQIAEGVVGFLRQEQQWGQKIQFIKENNGDLVLFHKPIPGHRYVVSVDPARGLQPDGTDDPDETVVHVYDLDDPEGMRQVAVYAGQLPEEEIIEPVRLIAAWYNLAYVVVLTSGGFGEYTVSEVVKEYPMDRVFRTHNVNGLKEHAGNRTDFINRLAASIDSSGIFFHHWKTVDQLKHFKRSRSGKLEAETGWHDDHVSAAYAAVYAASFWPQSLRPVNSGTFNWRESVFSHTKHRQLRGDMDSIGGYSPC